MLLGLPLAGPGGFAPLGAGPGPRASRPPSISGDARPGGTLSADPGQWSGAGAITFAYRWLLDGVPLGGESGASLRVRAGQAGQAGRLRCLVSASDDTGTRSLSTPPRDVEDGWSLSGGAGLLRLHASPVLAAPVPQGGPGIIQITE